MFHSLHDKELSFFKGKTVLVRADLNVPLDASSKVTDTTRIERSLATLKYLQKAEAKIVLMSHLGRPKGEKNASLSLKHIQGDIESLWGNSISFVEECIGAGVKEAVATLKEGHILLLENLRFHKEEKENDPAFAKELASLGDVYVNDAFSTAHRAHASTEGITAYLPSFAGLLMEEELKHLQIALENPRSPVMAIVGGAKVSTKLSVLTNLIDKVDHLVIGGGMANTFLGAQGIEVGNSLQEQDLYKTALEVLEKAKTTGCTIHLPQDIVVSKEFKAHADFQVKPVNECPKDSMILDLGPESAETLASVIAECKTLIWNGPMGAFEIPPFDKGTLRLAQAAAQATREQGLTSVAGGGDTVSALSLAGVENDFSYISTAGGAFLEWMEGKKLPGIVALSKS